MFVRKVSIRLKKDTLSEFTKTFEQQIVPVLRKQKGFKDDIVLAVPGGQDVLAISLWETQLDAEAYNSSDYKNVLKTLENVIEGNPKVGTPEILHTTLYESHVATSAA
jgi:heme-degrading monooxygenase HmoA